MTNKKSDKNCQPNIFTVLLSWLNYLDKHRIQGRALIFSISLAIIILAYKLELREFFNFIIKYIN